MVLEQRQKGIAAVEFAIVLIPLLVILTGITEFGRAMYYYNTIAKSTRDATRLMTIQTPTDPDYPILINRARCTAVYGNQACSGAPLVPGLTTAMVNICDAASCPGTHSNVQTGTGIVNLVSLTIGGPNNPYMFQSLAPFAPALFGIASFDFGPVEVTMRQML